MLDIILPIGGKQFFAPPYDDVPVLLRNVRGKPVLYWALQHLERIDGPKRYLLIGERSVIERYKIDRVLGFYTDAEVRCLMLEAPTQGAACSLLMSIDQIDPDAEVLVASLDQVLDHDLTSDIMRYRNNGAMAGLWHFDSVHPKWSYARLEGSEVREVREKTPISTNALTSLYWFAKAEAMYDALMASIRRDSPIGGVFYLAPALNEFVLQAETVGATEVASSSYHNFYDMQQILAYERVSDADHSLVPLTEAYVAAFDAKDLPSVAAMMADGVSLMDSFTPRITGKDGVVTFVGGLFEAKAELTFHARRISQLDGTTTSIEFDLTLDGEPFEGIDILTWQAGLITRLDAYLHPAHPKQDD